MRTKKNLILGTALCFALSPASLLFAQQPVQNIDPGRHPNLASAQRSIAHAYAKIESAQQANRDHLGDHAQRAKDLLAQASQELKEAARYANHHH
ncbi:MAG: hypothetical protein ACRD28_03155 [Acidobacteriaceae bacterium]